MKTVTPEELVEIARDQYGLGLVDLEDLLGTSVGAAIRDKWAQASPDEAMLDLELLIVKKTMKEKRGDAGARLPRGRDPSRVGHDDVEGAQDELARGGRHGRDERELEVVALGVLPHAPTCRSRVAWCRCTAERRTASLPVAKPGKRLPYRRMHRPKGSPLPVAPIWLREGAATRHDVWQWLSHAWRSQDVVEAAVVKALRRAIFTGDGELDRRTYASLFGAIALAFVLWHLTRVTLRRGSWAGVVMGVPRGDLARMLPVVGRSLATRLPGQIHPDTITRYLRQLRRVLGREGVGLLEWHQPQPKAAAARGLPRSSVLLSDGSALTEAYNLYTFRGVEFVKNSTPSPPAPSPTHPVDRRSGHFTPEEIQRVGGSDATQTGGCGTRAGPANGSGTATRPLSSPPASAEQPDARPEGGE